MDSPEVAALFDQAVERSRVGIASDDYEDMWELLHRAAKAGRFAASLAITQMTSLDVAVRSTACDLLGVASQTHEEIREDAAAALLSLAANEADDEVRWSIARALGATDDARATPVLVSLAGSPDPEIRLEVAMSLPAVLVDDADQAGVTALVDLCGDLDPQVRNWAAFGLGWQSTADGRMVRQALWERTSDSYGEAREEGIRGLARRRDQRALPLVADLLAQQSVHPFTFEAAGFLGHPSLVPLLESFDPTSHGVAAALRECDPLRRARRDASAMMLFDTLHARLPDVEMAIFAERFELGLELEVTGGTDGNRTARWSVEALLARAGGDPQLAAQLAADDLMS
ncbi:HEAT repeat domain-containing protein [Micromonospora soli]|uniref:HEAT repeat domain-containing protein n=1 Tax=Micromonospora sp. NBRC 110009 TaxID=3061627 RepID=UPI0026726D72|nr:HEAT repeat domain-containing protein [Micromonospora sp. NBRC 110009]WKT98164.1 HEAT repeat domain-containing protein [Micromonospora sp. NBRC 110009]